jgi:hypothetical protein
MAYNYHVVNWFTHINIAMLVQDALKQKKCNQLLNVVVDVTNVGIKVRSVVPVPAFMPDGSIVRVVPQRWEAILPNTC